MTKKALTLGQTLAHNLVRMRAERDRSQRALAADMRRAGGHKWTDVTVSNVERGDRSVSIDELVALALALGVKPSSLLSTDAPVILAGQALQAQDFNDWIGEGTFTLGLTPDGGLTKIVAIGQAVEKRLPSTGDEQ